MSDEPQDFFTKLASETARVAWVELERFFAKGMLISIDASLDLVEVGVCFAEDNKTAIEAWMNENKIKLTESEEAIQWQQSDPDLWALVVPPWVLVQEKLPPAKVH